MAKPKPEAAEVKAEGADASVETENTTPVDAAPEAPKVKVRVLTECVYGKADDVVELTESEATQATADGIADAHPDAVAYAESLVVETPAE